MIFHTAPGTRSARLALLATGLLAIGLAGCSTTTTSQGKPASTAKGRDGIDELHLFGIPVALNLDGTRGADGIGVRIYASSAARAHGLPIRRGALEILMFDGTAASVGQAGIQEPRHTWKFSAAELASYTATTSIGTGYQLALRWGEAKPTKDNVSIIARYLAPDGSVIASSSSTISVSVK